MTEKKKRFLSLSVKPLFVLLLGLVLGVCMALLAESVGEAVIERCYLSEAAVLKRTNRAAQELQGYLDSDPVMALDGCAGKIVAGFTWRYVGVCSAKQGEKLLGQDGKPLRSAVEISFPGRMEKSFISPS